MIASEFESFLHEQIPLSRALGMRVARVDHDSVELRSPLEPNRNHLGTAFGGSLAAVAILAGYAWIFQALQSRGHEVHVILKSSSIQYLKPVEEDFSAECTAPDQASLENFLKTYEKKSVARIDLASRIKTSQGIACELKCEFVVRRA